MKAKTCRLEKGLLLGDTLIQAVEAKTLQLFKTVQGAHKISACITRDQGVLAYILQNKKEFDQCLLSYKK